MVGPPHVAGDLPLVGATRAVPPEEGLEGVEEASRRRLGSEAFLESLEAGVEAGCYLRRACHLPAQVPEVE